MKFTNHAAHKRIVRGRALPHEKKMLLNKMYYDDLKTPDKIMLELKLGQTTLDRELFTTRAEWEMFKQCNEN